MFFRFLIKEAKHREPTNADDIRKAGLDYGWHKSQKTSQRLHARMKNLASLIMGRSLLAAASGPQARELRGVRNTGHDNTLSVGFSSRYKYLI